MQVEEAEEEEADTQKHTGKPAKEPPEEPAAAPGPPPAAAPASAAEPPAQAEAPSQPAPEAVPAAASGGAAGEAAKESKEDPAAEKQPVAAAEAEPATAKEGVAGAPAQPVVQDQAVTGLLQVRPAAIVFSAFQASTYLRSAWSCRTHCTRYCSCVRGLVHVVSAHSCLASCPDEVACAGAGGRVAERAGHAAAAFCRRHVPAGAPSVSGHSLSAHHESVPPAQICQDQASRTE